MSEEQGHVAHQWCLVRRRLESERSWNLLIKRGDGDGLAARNVEIETHCFMHGG